MNPSAILSFLFLLCLPNLFYSQCISGNCIDGTGTYLYSSGAKYVGDFKDGRMNGYGMCKYSDGSIYKGDWKNGYPDGKGKKVYSDGTEWTGRWKEGQPINKFENKFNSNKIPNNSSIATKAIPTEGCISGNCTNGYGIYIYKNQSARYEGTFLNEEAHGHGNIVYSNGDQYIGEWVNGNFEGEGTLTLKNGKKIAGYWKAGAHISNAPSLQHYPNRDQYVNKEMNVRAVIIGISSYNHMPALRYTDDDAYRMYAFLKSPEGGALTDENIKILIDEEATKKQILYTLEEVFTQASPNDLVMLYFSGHGLPGSFLPSDYDGYNHVVHHDEIKNILNRSPAKYKLCIADACHSGGLLAMKGNRANNALLKYYEVLAQASPGSALIMSSKSSETSLESSGLRQGVFSHFLIKGLKGAADANQDKIVNIQELFDYTYRNVRSYTGSRQSPVIKGNFDRQMPVAVIR